MATKHPRIAVTRDPELTRALERTKDLLDEAESRTGAAQIRALALRGARAVVEGAGPQRELRVKLSERHGTQPASSSLSDLGLPPGAVDPDDPRPASDALRWVRGD